MGTISVPDPEGRGGLFWPGNDFLNINDEAAQQIPMAGLSPDSNSHKAS